MSNSIGFQHQYCPMLAFNTIETMLRPGSTGEFENFLNYVKFRFYELSKILITKASYQEKC